MKYLWKMTLDQYTEVCELAISKGKVAGDNIQDEIEEIMNKYGQEPQKVKYDEEEIKKKAKENGFKVLDLRNKKEGDNNVK